MNSLNHEVFYQAKHFSLQYHLKHYRATTSHTHKLSIVNKACLQLLPLWANKQPLVNHLISSTSQTVEPYHPGHRPKSATMSTQTFLRLISLPTELQLTVWEFASETIEERADTELLMHDLSTLA